MNLRDIGYQNLGRERFRFSQCAFCGANYPHAASMTASGRPTQTRETPGPMMNGREIHECPCGQSLRAGVRISSDCRQCGWRIEPQA